MRILSALLSVIKELARPGVGSPYVRGVIFAAHALVSAALVNLLGVSGFAAAASIAIAYALLKERRDIMTGGGIWDSLEDTAGIAMGGFYGAALWPVYVLGTAFGIMVLAEARR